MRREPLIIFVCLCCEASRTYHTICCGNWPLAVDIDDQSMAALVAS